MMLPDHFNLMLDIKKKSQKASMVQTHELVSYNDPPWIIRVTESSTEVKKGSPQLLPRDQG